MSSRIGCRFEIFANLDLNFDKAMYESFEQTNEDKVVQANNDEYGSSTTFQPQKLLTIGHVPSFWVHSSHHIQEALWISHLQKPNPIKR